MTPIRHLLRPLALVLLLAGCQHDRLQETEASLLAANEQAGHAFGPEISAEDFAAHIKVVASDEFGGRQPGSDGETKTTEYLREQFQRLGLEPGNGNSYFQTVPMVETRADTATSKMTICSPNESGMVWSPSLMVILLVAVSARVSTIGTVWK